MLSILRCINPIPFRGNIVRFYITKNEIPGGVFLVDQRFWLYHPPPFSGIFVPLAHNCFKGCEA